MHTSVHLKEHSKDFTHEAQFNHHDVCQAGGELMKDAVRLHYGKCRIQGLKSQDVFSPPLLCF